MATNARERRILDAWMPPANWDGGPRPDLCIDIPEAVLPYSNHRLDWALRCLGWSSEEMARRSCTHDSNIRQMRRGRRDIPDNLAIWLESWLAAVMPATLALPARPAGWRDWNERKGLVMASPVMAGAHSTA